MNLVVYTCIVGGRDNVKEAPTEDGTRCICYTDTVKEPTQQNGWELIPISHKEKTHRLTNRWHKTHPHLLEEVKDSKYYLYIDGSIILRKSPQSYVKALKKDKKDIGTVRHWVRNCPYSEAKVVRSGALDTASRIDKMVAKLKEDNYPVNNGLNCGGFILLKNDKKAKEFNEEWWNYIKNYCSRDQLSLNYCINKHGLTIQSLEKNDTYILKGHKK